MSLAVIGQSAALRSGGRARQGVSLALMGLRVFGSTVWHAFVLGVWATASRWPGVIVAGVMAALFLSSSVQIVAQAVRERREPGRGGRFGNVRGLPARRRAGNPRTWPTL